MINLNKEKLIDSIKISKSFIELSKALGYKGSVNNNVKEKIIKAYADLGIDICAEINKNNVQIY